MPTKLTHRLIERWEAVKNALLGRGEGCVFLFLVLWSREPPGALLKPAHSSSCAVIDWGGLTTQQKCEFLISHVWEFFLAGKLLLRHRSLRDKMAEAFLQTMVDETNFFDKTKRNKLVAKNENDKPQ